MDDLITGGREQQPDDVVRWLAPSYEAFLEAIRTRPPAQWPVAYIAGSELLAGSPGEPGNPERQEWIRRVAAEVPAPLPSGAPWWTDGVDVDVITAGVRTFQLDRSEGGR